MNNIMFLSSNPVQNKKSPRPESPGGYFTLSDSDGGSNPGTESSFDEEGPSVPNSRNSMYKLYKRSRSEPPNSMTKPKRPSPPKNGVQIEDIDAPPRPPPPLSYTSTLPPPVPKKVNKKGYNLRKVNPPPPPPPLAHFGPRTKPLQRVQPLQIQSPSMIQILQHTPSTAKLGSTFSTSSSDDNSLDGAVTMKKRNSSAPPCPSSTFVSAFQRATQISKNAPQQDPNLKPRPPLKCDNNKSNNKKVTSRTGSGELAGYMRPTKTAVLKQANNPENQFGKKAALKSCSSGSENEAEKGGKKVQNSKIRRSISVSSSSLSDENENLQNKNNKKKTRTKIGENSSSKLKKLKNSVCHELKRSASDKSVLTSNKPKTNSIQSTKSETNVNKKVSKNPIHNLIKFYESSQSQKQSLKHLDKQPIVILEDKEPSNESQRVSTASHLSQLSQMSAEKIQSWLSNPMMLSSLENDLSVTEISILDQYVTDMISLSEVNNGGHRSQNLLSDSDSDDKYPRVIRKSDLNQSSVKKRPGESPKIKKSDKNKSPKVGNKIERCPKVVKMTERFTKMTQSGKSPKSKRGDSKSKTKRSEESKSIIDSKSDSDNSLNLTSKLDSKIMKKPEKSKMITSLENRVMSPIEKSTEKSSLRTSSPLQKASNSSPTIKSKVLSHKEKSCDNAIQRVASPIQKSSLSVNDLEKKAEISPEKPITSNKSPRSKKKLTRESRDSNFTQQKHPRILSETIISHTPLHDSKKSLNDPTTNKGKIFPNDDKNQPKSAVNQEKPQITVIEENNIPSEEDLQRGVFTEISCAGNVAKAKLSDQIHPSDLAKKVPNLATIPPVPSPRVKKRARKEQMLLEHKNKGHEALSQILKQLKVKEPEENDHTKSHENSNDNDPCGTEKNNNYDEDCLKNNNEDVLQCLNDLCEQSKLIQEDIKNEDHTQTKNDNNQVGHSETFFTLSHFSKICLIL